MVKTKPATTISIELYEDFSCPWCRIGRANLARAIDRWQGSPVIVRHRPFMLDPEIPPQGNEYHAYLSYKLGGNVDQMHEAITAAGKQAGVEFDFTAMRYAPNTLAAHMLVELAPEEAREPIVASLFEAHFHGHRNIGSLDVLADIAEQHGVDGDLAHSLDLSNPARKHVAKSMQEAQQLGLTGVPFYVFDDRFGVSGAQSADTILQVLGMVRDERDRERGNGRKSKGNGKL